MSTAEIPRPDPDLAKACCARAYEHDAVRLILGETYHPGGLALTRRLAERLQLRAGQRVLDVASGPGSTALMLAREYDVIVDGVDLGERTIVAARQAAADAGLNDRVRFHVGDAERLPFEDATYDAVVCECALCTFPDKGTAAREFARVLRPGGRLGITDVTVSSGGLPAELAGLAGWVACLADARPIEDYLALCADAGLSHRLVERHDEALATMVEHIHGRLSALKLIAGSLLALAGVDFDRAQQLTGQAEDAVASGAAGYALLVAERPGR